MNEDDYEIRVRDDLLEGQREKIATLTESLLQKQELFEEARRERDVYKAALQAIVDAYYNPDEKFQQEVLSCKHLAGLALRCKGIVNNKEIL